MYDHIPGIAIATASHPIDLLPGCPPQELADKFEAAQLDFEQRASNTELHLQSPTVTCTRIGGDRYIGLKFQPAEQRASFTKLRPQVIAMAFAALSSYEHVNKYNEWIDEIHGPELFLPIVRPYRGVEVSHILDTLNEAVSRHELDSVRLLPYLCTPCPYEVGEDAQSRLDAIKQSQINEIRSAMEANRFTGRFRDIGQRIIRFAQNYPDAWLHLETVRGYFPIANTIPPNLTVDVVPSETHNNALSINDVTVYS